MNCPGALARGKRGNKVSGFSQKSLVPDFSGLSIPRILIPLKPKLLQHQFEFILECSSRMMLFLILYIFPRRLQLRLTNTDTEIVILPTEFGLSQAIRVYPV